MNTQNTPDYTPSFERLRQILSELHQKLNDRLILEPKPADQPLQSFSSPDGSVTGSLQTSVGAEVDWLVYSWLNALSRGLATMRLTTWLNAKNSVPHLAFEFGVFSGQLFFYMDYIPRIDLWSDLAYVERYYEPIDSTYLNLRNNANLTLFVSKGLYLRQVQSPVHLCFTCPATEDSFALIHTTAHEMADRWLTWLDQAEAVPSEMQSALTERDRRMRRFAAERDSGNAMMAKIFGQSLTDQLVQSLWDQS